MAYYQALQDSTAQNAQKKPLGRHELQEALQRADRKSFSERYLQPALVAELIEMIIPDKPNSRLQQYRLTDKGRALL